jgi:hypothetical protein
VSFLLVLGISLLFHGGLFLFGLFFNPLCLGSLTVLLLIVSAAIFARTIGAAHSRPFELPCAHILNRLFTTVVKNLNPASHKFVSEKHANWAVSGATKNVSEDEMSVFPSQHTLAYSLQVHSFPWKSLKVFVRH